MKERDKWKDWQRKGDSLFDLFTVLKESEQVLESLRRIVAELKKHESSPKSVQSSILLSTLFNWFSESKSVLGGKHEMVQLSERIFWHVWKDYERILKIWIKEGSLIDPVQEFFICRSSIEKSFHERSFLSLQGSQNKSTVLDTLCDVYQQDERIEQIGWEGEYFLRGGEKSFFNHCPSFLSRFAHIVCTIGKSRKFLSQFSRRNDDGILELTINKTQKEKKEENQTTIGNRNPLLKLFNEKQEMLLRKEEIIINETKKKESQGKFPPLESIFEYLQSEYDSICPRLVYFVVKERKLLNYLESLHSLCLMHSKKSNSTFPINSFCSNFFEKVKKSSIPIFSYFTLTL